MKKLILATILTLGAGGTIFLTAQGNETPATQNEEGEVENMSMVEARYYITEEVFAVNVFHVLKSDETNKVYQSIPDMVLNQNQIDLANMWSAIEEEWDKYVPLKYDMQEVGLTIDLDKLWILNVDHALWDETGYLAELQRYNDHMDIVGSEGQVDNNRDHSDIYAISYANILEILADNVKDSHPTGLNHKIIWESNAIINSGLPDFVEVGGDYSKLDTANPTPKTTEHLDYLQAIIDEYVSVVGQEDYDKIMMAIDNLTRPKGSSVDWFNSASQMSIEDNIYANLHLSLLAKQVLVYHYTGK